VSAVAADPGHIGRITIDLYIHGFHYTKSAIRDTLDGMKKER